MAWVLGLIVVCAAAGDRRLFLDIVPFSLALSVAMTALFILVLELFSRSSADRLASGGALATIGVLATYVAIVLLLDNAWIAPRLEANAEASKLLDSLQAVYRTPTWVPPILLGAGATALIASLFRATRKS